MNHVISCDVCLIRLETLEDVNIVESLMHKYSFSFPPDSTLGFLSY